MPSSKTMLQKVQGGLTKLKSRPTKNLDPRRRISSAQRWNSLVDISENELNRLAEVAGRTNNPGDLENYSEFVNALSNEGIYDPGIGFNPPMNPFLSKSPSRYNTQQDFLNWCRKYRIEPNQNTLEIFKSGVDPREAVRVQPLNGKPFITDSDGYWKIDESGEPIINAMPALADVTYGNPTDWTKVRYADMENFNLDDYIDAFESRPSLPLRRMK